MKKLFLLAFITTTVLFTNCKNSGSDNPTSVLSSFFDAMQKNDKVKIKELSTAESAAMIGMMELGMDKDNKDMQKFDKSKVEFGKAVINGDNAKVPVKDKEKGETVNFPMKKENGQWKVAFDKTSMMEMVSDKMKEKGVNINDTLSKAMEDIKKLGTDSLKNKMDDDMKELKDLNLDSLKTEMKKAMEKK